VLKMEDFDDFVEAVENDNAEEEEEIQRLPKRYIRDAQNPLQFFRNKEFLARFRFSKNTFLYIILPLVINVLRKPSRRGLPVSPLFQVLWTLRYYGTGSLQVCIFNYLMWLAFLKSARWHPEVVSELLKIPTWEICHSNFVQ